MRVLHLCDSLNPAGLGGYESYLFHLSSLMKSMGHESIVATQAPSDESPAHGTHGGASLVYLRGNGLEARKWKFLAAPAQERERLVSQLFSAEDLENNVEKLASEVRALITQYRPSVIHCHSTYVVFNRVIEILRSSDHLKRTGVLLTVHGLRKPLILPDGTKTTDYEQLSLHAPFDLILSVSNCVKSALEREFGTRDRPRVENLYLGVNRGLFRPEPQTEKRWDLAFMGRLERMKAVDLLPNLVQSVSTNHPSVRLVITGDGSYRHSLLSDFKKKGVLHRVDYLGVVMWEEVPHLINSSKVFLYPSREEPFGLSIVEAMACGVPVVTSNVFGPNEIVTEGFDGLTVAPDDPEALAAAVKSLLDSEKLRTKLARNAERTVKCRFDLANHAKKILSVYSSVSTQQQ